MFNDDCNGIGNASIFYNKIGMYIIQSLHRRTSLFLITSDVEKVVKSLWTLLNLRVKYNNKNISYIFNVYLPIHRIYYFYFLNNLFTYLDIYFNMPTNYLNYLFTWVLLYLFVNLLTSYIFIYFLYMLHNYLCTYVYTFISESFRSPQK